MMIRGRHRHLALLAGLLLLGQAARAAAQAKEAVPGLEAVVEQREHVSTELARLAGGLERALKKDDVKAAESLYGMERAAIRLLEVTSVAAFPSEVSRLETQQSVRMLLTRILQLQERVQQHAIAELDRSLPGEPDREGWARSGNDLYRPLYRLGTPVPGQPQKTPAEALAEMKAKFAAKGGKPGDFHFLSRKSLAGLPSGQLAEWVQFGKERVRFTTAGAKHPVIGKGKSVRGAGSIKVFKDGEGKVLVAIVSNSSGNYKPGPGSTEGPVQQLVKAGVPESHIVVTSIIPEEPELVKLLLKSKKTFTDEQIKTHVQGVRDRTAPPPLPARVLAKASAPSLGKAGAGIRTPRTPRLPKVPTTRTAPRTPRTPRIVQAPVRQSRLSSQP